MKRRSLGVMPAAQSVVGARSVRALLGLLAVAVLLGCSSSTKSGRATYAGESASGAVAPAQAEPARIRSLEIEPQEAGSVVVLAADRAPVWTTYRDAEGRLVVELPNSVPEEAVASMSAAEGLLSGIEVERIDDSERPLTRLVLSTRAESEHALTTEGDSLRIQLLPVGYEGPAIVAAYEPLPDSPGEEPAAAMPAGPETSYGAAPKTAAYGTPEAPLFGPEPTGAPASQLTGVEYYQSGEETIVQIYGDGDFRYSTFRLENPERFVIDLAGVVNTSDRSTVPVEAAVVDQIRIGQFKPRPEPISRVVFDLREFAPPVIAPSANGLMLIFGGSAPAAAPAEPAEAVVAEVETEGMAEPPPVEEESAPMEELPVYEPEPVEMAAEAPPTEVEEWTEPAAEVEEAPRWEPEAPAEAPAPMVAEAPPAEAPQEIPAEDMEVAPAPAARMGEGPGQEELAEVPVFEPMPGEAPEAPPGWEPTVSRPVGSSDVAMFEAQGVQVQPPPEEEQPVFSQFDALIVNRQNKTYVGEPISMSLRNADLVETLRTFARISELNFVIQPGVRGSVTVELNEVPWDQAMEQILKINNLGMDIDGTIVRIAPMSQLRAEAEEQRRLAQARAATVPLRTVMRSVSYANANDIARILRNRTGSLLSARGTVQVDARTNTVILRELPNNLDTVLSVIDNLDTPEPQVAIEARIIEATKQFTRTLGISWGYTAVSSAETGNTTGLQFPNNGTSDGGVALLTGGANGFLNLSLGNILNTFNLDGRIQAAENEGLVNVISAPRVTTLNNERASIQSGLQIPIQTVTNNTVSVQFVNATLQLAVTPHVTAEGTILLDINVAKREPQLAFAVVGASNAPISTKEAQTRVIVRDGGTAVIGGIYEVTTNHNQDRVPGLANVPVIGHLFKNNSRDDRNEELMIFITPRIVQM